jgi:hypothetical protein
MGVYNECIDSTVDHIHVCFDVFLTSDDPRTSWSFNEWFASVMGVCVVEVIGSPSRLILTRKVSVLTRVLSTLDFRVVRRTSHKMEVEQSTV